MAFDFLLNMVFNKSMTDSELIEHLGGPTKVAELLQFDKAGGVQRVQNWITRGIPAQVKVDHPAIFMTGFNLADKDRRKSERRAQADRRATSSLKLQSPQQARKSVVKA